ncbi:hypothetical protein N7517_010904 [Penicillium concentricum]|uniref:F-box domain-containing protein n=1 Tax=Penicillium concentricum TaxID=293559 RepID=A0A9W9RB45_9EURO|nr:uncharacterized protein N7517_010904 [Penicillium concentricum]KAJ5356295.1 hypothetical protein N7517_010904 [Penicillium concentricum]
MSFSNLPNEVILLLVPHFEYESDINALCRTTRWLHGLLNTILYDRSASYQRDGGYTLEWAAINGSTSTVRLILEAAAPPDACGSEPWQPFALAALHGHSEIMELLYEQGINPLSTLNDWKNPLSHGEDPEDRAEGHPLSMAASHGHVTVVNILLEYGVRPDIHIGNYERRTALHFAAEQGHLDVVRALADAGCSIDAQDKNGETPLAFAAQKDHLDIVEFLLSRGADPNIATEYYGTSLCRASSSGNINIVQCLLDHGATPNPSCPDGRKPLFQLSRAALGGHNDILDLLLTRFDYVKSSTEPYQQAILLCVAAITGRTTLITDVFTKHNCDPNLRVTDERIFHPYSFSYMPPQTALAWAAECNQPAIIDILFSHGASMTLPTEGPPVLLRSIQKGHKEATATLLAHGANPNDPPGKALSIAVTNPTIFSLLLSHNADPTTPLPNSCLLAEILYSRNVETLRILLDHPKGPELVVDPLPVGNETGSRLIPLFHAALIGGEGVLRLLLDRGLLASPTELDDRTMIRYLHLAAGQGSVSLMRLILDIGCDVHAGGDTGDLIHQAATAKEDPEGLLDFLLQNGCSIDDTNFVGRTALFLSAYDNDESVMRRLLDRRADPLLDCLGVNVLSIAVKESNLGAVKMLLKVFDERKLGFGELEEVLKQAEKDVWIWEVDRHIAGLLHRFYWHKRYPVSTSDDLSLVS